MSERLFQRGLVVGKFAPLHRGHILLIERALALCREVVALSYADPEPPGCPAVRRERWLRTLYPQIRGVVATPARVSAWLPQHPVFSRLPADDAPDDVHRRFCAALLRDHLGLPVDAVFTSEDYGEGFASVLTREQRLRWPEAAPVAHVSVDPPRNTLPISGTAIRADVHAHRRWLHPEVYADFIERVCLLGAESTGKSTLAAALARELGTVHVGEYGRELWEARGGALRFEDFRAIVEAQVAREEAACRDEDALHWVFCDTSPLTTLFYQQWQSGRTDPAVEAAAARRYEHTFLCAPDFPLVQDGTRQDEAFRQRQHAWFLEQLARRGIPFTLLEGPPGLRLAAVRAALAC